MASTTKLEVVTLCGSMRKDSFNAALLRALPEIAPGDMLFTDGPAVADIPIYDGDLERMTGFPSAVTAVNGLIRQADGVIIVSPEYNYSVPGGLKNMIDWISRTPDQPFAGKPVLIQSVSAGHFGGVRMQHHLRQILVFLNARVFVRPEVMIGPASAKFSAEGELIDPASREAVRVQLAEFAKFIHRIAS